MLDGGGVDLFSSLILILKGSRTKRQATLKKIIPLRWKVLIAD